MDIITFIVDQINLNVIVGCPRQRVVLQGPDCRCEVAVIAGKHCGTFEQYPTLRRCLPCFTCVLLRLFWREGGGWSSQTCFYFQCKIMIKLQIILLLPNFILWQAVSCLRLKVFVSLGWYCPIPSDSTSRFFLKPYFSPSSLKSYL